MLTQPLPLQTAGMVAVHEGPLSPTKRESCAGGNLASTLLAGYHPDQVTKSIVSGTLTTNLSFR